MRSRPSRAVSPVAQRQRECLQRLQKHTDQQQKHTDQQQKHTDQQHKHTDQQHKHTDQQHKHTDQQHKHTDQQQVSHLLRSGSGSASVCRGCRNTQTSSRALMITVCSSTAVDNAPQLSSVSGESRERRNLFTPYFKRRTEMWRIPMYPVHFMINSSV